MEEAVNSLSRLPTIVKNDENRTVVSMTENAITAYFPLFVFKELRASLLTAFLLLFDILRTFLFVFYLTEDRVAYNSFQNSTEIFHI